MRVFTFTISSCLYRELDSTIIVKVRLGPAPMLRGQRAGWREGSERLGQETDGSSTRYHGRVRIQLSANPVPNTLKTDNSRYA